jgi:hypothetical protein
MVDAIRIGGWSRPLNASGPRQRPSIVMFHVPAESTRGVKSRQRSDHLGHIAPLKGAARPSGHCNTNASLPHHDRIASTPVPIPTRSSTSTGSCPRNLATSFGPLRQSSVPPSPLPGIETYIYSGDPSDCHPRLANLLSAFVKHSNTRVARSSAQKQSFFAPPNYTHLRDHHV